MSEDTKTPTLLAMLAEGFLSRLSFGLVSFALPLYAYHLGLSLTEIGLLTSLNLVVSVLLKPISGRLADWLGLKRMMTAAIGLRSLISLLLVFAATPLHLYLIRALHGSAKSMRDPVANALIAESGGKKRIATSFAWYQTAKSVAGAGGKALAGILLTWTASNFALVFGVAFLLSALPWIAVACFVRPDRWEQQPVTPIPAPDLLAQPASAVMPPAAPPVLLPFVILGGLISGSAQMLGGLFPILATEYAGLTAAQTGLIYTVSTLVILFSGPFFGWLSDNVSRKLVLSLRSVANVASSLIYLAAPTFAGVAVGRTVDDLGKSAFRPAWGALMAQVAALEPRKRVRTMSWMSVGEDVGEIVAPIFAGFLWSGFGIAVLLGVRALLALVTEIYAFWLADPFLRDETVDGSMDRTVK